MIKKILLILVILVVIGFSLYQAKVPHKLVGNYLAPSDKLTKADAIVVVSGSDDRIKHAIELYKQGLAPKLVLSGAAKEGPVSNAKAMQIQASQAGISEEATILEEKSANTVENALYSKDIIVSNQFKNVILVSSPYHQRRVYENFKELLIDHNVKLQNSPSPYSNWSPDHWWDSEEEREITKNELAKIAWSLIGGDNQ